jgi:hypothetical protein
MHSEYIPPEYLSFKQFFKEVSIALNINNISPELLQFEKDRLRINEEDADRVYLNHMNKENIQKIEAILDGSSQPAEIFFEVAECKFLKNKVRIKGKELKFLKFENEQYIFEDHSWDKRNPLFSNRKTQEWQGPELRIIAEVAKIQNYIRDSIASSTVGAIFIYNNIKKISLTPEILIEPYLWHMLMRVELNLELPPQYLDSAKLVTEDKFIVCNQIYMDKEFTPVRGKILFKKDEVIALCESIKDYSTTKNNKKMFFYISPWMEIMSHFSLLYREKIFSTEKINSLKTEIGNYIQEKKLDIPDSDILYLAKFIRHPDQRKGKRHYDRKKNKNLNISKK